MANILFLYIFIENKFKHGIYSVVTNLNHVFEPNSNQDFDIDYYTGNKNTNFCLKSLKKHAKSFKNNSKILTKKWLIGAFEHIFR